MLYQFFIIYQNLYPNSSNTKFFTQTIPKYFFNYLYINEERGRERKTHGFTRFLKPEKGQIEVVAEVADHHTREADQLPLLADPEPGPCYAWSYNYKLDMYTSFGISNARKQ